MMTKSWIILVWVGLLLLLVYFYFYQPAFFQHVFQYPGAGSPYVNTPEGAI